MAAESAFRTAFWVLFAGLLLMRAWFVLQVRRAGERVMPDRQAVEREGRGMFAVRVVAFVVLLALLALYAFDSPLLKPLSLPLPDWLRWAGFALGLVSLAFWTWTQRALGTEWSPQLQLRAEHHLVTTGPYARIRHPLYTAMIGLGTAFALISANGVFALLDIVAIAGLLIRVPREEQMMLDEFKDAYRDYMNRTGRFWPRLHAS